MQYETLAICCVLRLIIYIYILLLFLMHLMIYRQIDCFVLFRMFSHFSATYRNKRNGKGKVNLIIVIEIRYHSSFLYLNNADIALVIQKYVCSFFFFETKISSGTFCILKQRFRLSTCSIPQIGFYICQLQKQSYT